MIRLRCPKLIASRIDYAELDQEHSYRRAIRDVSNDPLLLRPRLTVAVPYYATRNLIAQVIRSQLIP